MEVLTRGMHRVLLFLPRYLLAAILILCLAGCQSINHLREAQDSFNNAAAMENRIRLEPLAGAPGLESKLNEPTDQVLADFNSVRSGYASTLLSLGKLSGKDERALKADRLWGVVLTLKAMAQWRLKDYDGALRTAEEAGLQPADQLYPRDAALLTALPGLIKIDLAYDKIAAMQPGNTEANRLLLEKEVRPRLVGLIVSDDNNAVYILRQARIKAGANHPINVYLIQSQLAAYRNYQVAYQKTFGKSPGNDDFAKKEAQYNLGELEALFNNLKFGQAGKTVIDSWKNAYTIIPETRPTP